MGVAVDEDGVDVVRAVVALERRDVRPEVVGCIREKDRILLSNESAARSCNLPLMLPETFICNTLTTSFTHVELRGHFYSCPCCRPGGRRRSHRWRTSESGSLSAANRERAGDYFRDEIRQKEVGIVKCAMVSRISDFSRSQKSQLRGVSKLLLHYSCSHPPRCQI